MKPTREGPAGRMVETLAEFRYRLRQFLLYSEQAAIHAGVQPQQHQLLLQIAGKAEGAVATIAYAAERLGLQHHSAVELVDRSEKEGLVARTKDAEDARRVILSVTRKGLRVLDELSADHACELRELGPRLVRSLDQIELLGRGNRSSAPRDDTESGGKTAKCGSRAQRAAGRGAKQRQG
jgi:DNA-binding MarR family transcriptional regulator